MSTNMRGRANDDHLSDKVLATRALARISAIAFLIAAGAIHATQIRVHAAEWNVAGLFFIASAAAQLGLAVALTRGINWRARDVPGLIRSFSAAPARKLVFGGVATSLTLILMWVVSRAFGVPFGPNAGMPEPVDRPDVLATTFELLTLAALQPLLRRRSDPRTSWMPRRAHTVVVAALLLSTVATTALALQPTACDTPRGAERLSQGEGPNQAAIAALFDHAEVGEHGRDEPEQRGRPEARRTEQTRVVDCH